MSWPKLDDEGIKILLAKGGQWRQCLYFEAGSHCSKMAVVAGKKCLRGNIATGKMRQKAWNSADTER